MFRFNTMDPTYHKDVVCGNNSSTLENFRQSLNVCLQHWDSETISRWHGCLFLMNGGPLLCDYLTYYIYYHKTLTEMSKMVKISKILLLIQHNIGIRLGTKSYTPLMKAIQTESEEIVRALLERGVDLYDTGTRMTYFEMALDSNTDGQYTLCKLLLEFGYDISTRNMRMQTLQRHNQTCIMNFNAIFYAVFRQNVEDIKFLLQNGLSPNETALCNTHVEPRNNDCNRGSGAQLQTMTPLFLVYFYQVLTFRKNY